MDDSRSGLCGRLVGWWSGGLEVVVEDADAEVQRVDRDAFVHPVEQRLVVESVGQLQRVKP